MARLQLMLQQIAYAIESWEELEGEVIESAELVEPGVIEVKTTLTNIRLVVQGVQQL